MTVRPPAPTVPSRRGRDAARVLLLAVCVATAGIAFIPFMGFGVINDKLDHVVAFGVILGLAGVAYPAASLRRMLLMALVAGVLMELLQASPIIRRDADPWDCFAGLVGAIVAATGLAVWRSRAACAEEQA